MPLKERQAEIKKLEKLRAGRRIVVICNLDRPTDPPQLPGLSTQFQEDIKEPLFRVLKETLQSGQGLDIFLYTRGGATNAVWPIVGLLREFDPNFEALIAFRAHSSGTLLALGAKRIVMGPLAELSPIDPTTANQFNPRDVLNQQATLGIAVEDVTAYQEFWKQTLDFKNEEGLNPDQRYALLQPHIGRLATEIHPLALGNVHRVYLQINLLARMLMSHHYSDDEAVTKKIIDSLTREYYSHHHMINRYEAQKILGEDHIQFADEPLAAGLDHLLRHYEEDFAMRQPFYLGRYMGDRVESARFIGAVIESAKWSYLNATEVKLRQYLAPPAGIQIQIPPGTAAPLVPGLPRQYEWQIIEQGWHRNTEPKGMTV